MSTTNANGNGFVIDRKSLAAVKAASRDTASFALNGLYIDSDGTAVGANKACMVAIEPPRLDPANHPHDGGVSLGEGLLITTDAAKALSTAIDSKGKGVRGAAKLIENTPENIQFAAANGNTVAVERIDGRFPAFRRVFNEPYHKRLTTAKLSVKYLQDVLAVAKAVAERPSEAWVEIGITGNPDDPALVRFIAGDLLADDGAADGSNRRGAAMIMPMQYDDAFDPSAWEDRLGAAKNNGPQSY